MSERKEIAVEKKETAKPEVLEKRQKVTLVPPVDIYEDEDGIVLLADMPGVKKDGLEIEVDKDVLTINGEITTGLDPLAKGLYQEFVGKEYKRVFTLGPDVDSSRIEAKISRGVLRLLLPKIEEVKPRKIEVKVA